jgi:hypothetical protein
MTKQEELIKKRVIDHQFRDKRVDASDIQVKVNSRESYFYDTQLILEFT